MVKITPVTLPGFHPAFFFSKLRPTETSAAYFTSGAWTVIAWDPSQSIVIDRAKQFSALQQRLLKRRRPRSNVPFIGGAIGYVSYDLGYELHGIAPTAVDRLGLPLGVFSVYDHALLFDGKRTLVIGDAEFVASVRDIHRRPAPSLDRPTMKWRASISPQRFARDFEKIQKGIREGDFYQLNHTYSYHAACRLDHRVLFASFLLTNPASCSSYVEHGDTAIASLSPERFVKIENGTITTCPIKGTRPRGRTPAADKKLSRALLASDKEAAELSMITDLLRNDIGKVSTTGSVKVKGHRLLQKNPSVWHTYSIIEGKLDPTVTPLDAFLSMFPGGSVTGCPKVAAMTEIDRLEKVRRGPYCGSMVMLSDDGTLDSSILIRTIIAKGDQLSLGVGGGIVADSVAADEWKETESKAKPFLESFKRTWINDQEVHPTDLRLFPLDPSSPDSSGLFETMRVENRRVVRFSAHMRRLSSSAPIIDMKLPRTLPFIRSLIQRLLKIAPTLPMRLKLVCTPKDVFLQIHPLLIDPAIYHGVAVIALPLQRRRPIVKSLPFDQELKTHNHALHLGFDDALILSPDGYIPEVATANLFWVQDGILHTADTRILPGTTRGCVLQLAKKLKIPIKFHLATLVDLHAADEVFLTRSTVGVVPVIRIGASSVGSGKVGKITARLRDGLRNLR